jgi:hypothetical protein
MLQKMRDARFSRRRIGAAGPIEEHLGHHGAAVILNHHHLKAIGQIEALGGEKLGARRQGRNAREN